MKYPLKFTAMHEDVVERDREIGRCREHLARQMAGRWTWRRHGGIVANTGPDTSYEIFSSEIVDECGMTVVSCLDQTPDRDASPLADHLCRMHDATLEPAR
jgi:hypothetical protein